MIVTEVLERVGGNESLLRELIELFLEDCPRCLREIQECLRQGDLHGVRQSAHLLRGSLGNFDVAAAYEAARHMEACARAGDSTAATAAWPPLQETVCRFVTDLAGLLPRPQATVPARESLT